jgi:hypothetical protein
VDNIADGRQFDQQDLGELSVAQIGRRRAQKRTPLAPHFPGRRASLCMIQQSGCRFSDKIMHNKN